MSDYVFMTDSTTDLPQSLVDSMNIRILPLTFTINDKWYTNHLDHREISPAEFYGQMRAGGRPTTSQITTHVYAEAFSPILEEGKDILFLSLSSAISGSALLI